MAESTIALCGCGCGLPAPIAKQTHTRLGLRKGDPFPFRLGHHMRARSTKTYRMVAGNQFLHRARAEASLGHPLPVGAEIHHPDRDPWNPNARLVICPSRAYHMLLHERMRVKEAGGNPNTDRLCSRCRQTKPIAAFWRTFKYCRICQAAARREFAQNNRDHVRQYARANYRKHQERYLARAADYRAKRKAQQQSQLDLPRRDTDTSD
jgi:hypothetical protein